MSVDYRIAPQHPYPAAIEDALAVTKEIVNDPKKLNLDLRDFFLAGDSAGGNLATVVALEFEHKLHIDGVVLLSPWLQMVNLKLPSCQLYNKHFFCKSLLNYYCYYTKFKCFDSWISLGFLAIWRYPTFYLGG